MTMISSVRHTRAARFATFAAVSLFTVVASVAQAPQARITSAINNASRAIISGSLSPRAVPANDVGALSASTRLQGISIVLSRTTAQQAALDALVAAQQNPTSPQYHQWLTPAQFGAQFGAAASDIAAIQNWLQQQGFTVDSVSNSRDRIFFSGTEGQVESAFGTQLHNYKSADGTHFAPSTAISIPSAIASSVLAVTNLSSFHPRSHLRSRGPMLAKPQFTSSQTGSYFLDPDDIATIYDIKAAYSAGYTGTGQSIAIMGQSAIVATDITNFQTALGIPTKAPTQVIVPGTGTSAINPQQTGDEAESDLDLEYSSATAQGATIYFVYTGNSANTNGVFTSLQYAVDDRIAPIISISYGSCEPVLGSAEYSSLNAILEQAVSQGQTVVSAAGDDGSTDCFGETTAVATEEELAVDFPGSSQYVTAVGGTEFPTADVTAPNTTYWTSATGTDVISSAKSYIPEEVWNDDAAIVSSGGTAASLLDAGAGGVSIFTPRPTWQTGNGITAGSFRLVPDISLDSSDVDAPYLYCSSDTSTSITGSCSNGFRDSSDLYLTTAGGTSFAAPQVAGIIALINQAKGYTTGQGLVNPTLYTLASTATSAFHDIVTGGNECLAGTAYCSTVGESEYVATTGYDEASGLGSIDVFNLITAWPSSSTATLLASTITLSPATTSPASGAADAVTISVGPVAATGTVTLVVDSASVSPITLSNGTATYSFSSTTGGEHVIVATYSGSALYAPSTTTLVVSVGGTTTTGGSVTLTAGNLTLAQGASGSSTLTVTPVNGYTGTFVFETIDSPSTLFNACASDPASATVTGTAAVTSTVTIYTSSTCPAGSVSLMKGAAGHFAHSAQTKVAAGNPASNPFQHAPLGPLPAGLASAGLLLVGILGRRSRKLRSVVAVCLLAVLGLAVSGCSNSATTAPPASTVDAPQGTYTLTLTGQDSANPTVTASANFTLVVN